MRILKFLARQWMWVYLKLNGYDPRIIAFCCEHGPMEFMITSRRATLDGRMLEEAWVADSRGRTYSISVDVGEAVDVNIEG